MASLHERLGYAADARLLIVNADDLGFCHAANVGVYETLRSGGATSASLMVPCPWGREAAARYRGEDIGVHLTLNAEQELYRWGPITHAPSLLGGDAGFPATVEDVWDHADLDETRRECRAQIERAILWGFDVSHVDRHLTTLQLRPEFFDLYLELAIEFQLPLRMVDDHVRALLGFPAEDLARSEGAVCADRLLTLPPAAEPERPRGDAQGAPARRERAPPDTRCRFARAAGARPGVDRAGAPLRAAVRPPRSANWPRRRGSR